MRQALANSASATIPSDRFRAARDCYMGDRLSTESPRIAIIVPQVPRAGRLTNIFPRLLQIVMLPGITRDAHKCERGRIGVRNVGAGFGVKGNPGPRRLVSSGLVATDDD